MWTPAWEFLGWYVNLEEPFRRTPLGFDVRDLQLDILVDPERKWRWKDSELPEPGVICDVARPGRSPPSSAAPGLSPTTSQLDPERPIPTLAGTP